MEYQRITIDVPEPLVELLQEIADNNRRSRSAQCVMALEFWAEKSKDAKNQRTAARAG